jgi:phosphoribosylglycinamide formyltransferase-1
MGASNSTPRIGLVVLISGRGSNLQSIIDATRNGSLPAEMRAVISNRAGAAGLERARRAGITAEVLDNRPYKDRERYDEDLMRLIDSHQPELVALAGFMRILSPAFVNHYRGRLLNIHPSLLPAFRGLSTHERVLAAGEREHGASVHFVTEQLDGGPTFLQVRVPVLQNDDPDTLAARVLRQEHRIYPLAIRWFAEGRVRLDDRGEVIFDGRPLPVPVMLEADPESAVPG